MPPSWPLSNLDTVLDRLRPEPGSGWKPEGFCSLRSRLDSRARQTLSSEVRDWLKSLETLPSVSVSKLELDGALVTIGVHGDLRKKDLDGDGNTISTPSVTGADGGLLEHLRALIPWRKGPFKLLGVEVDAEWRSDIKWQRILPAIGSLRGEKVLDVGANNGYYMFRMASLDPDLVLGIDPVARFKIQFETMQRFAQMPNLFHEILALEDMDFLPGCFDTVFCMGILYHQRSPLDALRILKRCLRPGGRLFLETLIYPGNEEVSLSPFPTYAKMKNVYFIPTLIVLENWLSQARFKDWEVLSTHPTTVQEQRNTAFCPPPAQSLADFLDPANPHLTVEGYPAPCRICLLTQA